MLKYNIKTCCIAYYYNLSLLNVFQLTWVYEIHLRNVISLDNVLSYSGKLDPIPLYILTLINQSAVKGVPPIRS